MRFTWDPAKARKNQKLHGVAFTTAAQIFDDPNHAVGDNYYMEETGEQRFQIIGMTRRASTVACNRNRAVTARERYRILPSTPIVKVL
jgi:uncharacterized DUF497 family protein